MLGTFLVSFSGAMSSHVLLAVHPNYMATIDTKHSLGLLKLLFNPNPASTQVNRLNITMNEIALKPVIF